MKAERAECYYCFAPISKNNREDDHFPIPDDCGGTTTVPACRTCHDLKDRFPLDRWSIELFTEWMEEMSALRSRVLRIYLAKTAAMLARANKERGIPSIAPTVNLLELTQLVAAHVPAMEEEPFTADLQAALTGSA